ncbi:hypothetical protein [Nocardioides deserti]|uniref:DUF3040 domain-containing protein n=1 Tax=Nocardioides deserti TaxID=1588644 RepID=A0ABR6U551_9ACTN|nr:hypothetical protein [Nocardioides deserti]MBC2959532.1 hypothetical protein [Nocardioides deserti]GGO73810.1 hypothetical protein GCM10012276_20320 [Nocardioides deserti]
MTRPDTEPRPDPREEEVRRRLADARHVEPLPVDVATRLDRVLAQLAEGEPLPSSVDELSVRRRRRAAGLLAAAAAVTVVGLGLGQVLPGAGSDAGSNADEIAASVDREAAERSTSADDEAAADAGDAAGRTLTEDGGADGSLVDPGDAPSEGDAAASAPAPEAAELNAFVTPPGRPVRVRSERFAADALRARDVVDGSRSGDRGTEDRGNRGRGDRGGTKPDLAFFECTPADWGAGVAVPVLYDDEPHVLVFRAPAGDSQVADLLQCGTGETLRSTTLPAG